MFYTVANVENLEKIKKRKIKIKDFGNSTAVQCSPILVLAFIKYQYFETSS